jgi:flagellin
MQIQVEVSQLIDEIDRVASHAQFNGMNMLTGRFAMPTGENTPTASMWFHIGANMDQREQVYIQTMTSVGLRMKELSTGQTLTIETPEKANRIIGVVDQALTAVSKQRADLGAYQTRLEYATKGLMSGYENLQASESRIRDTDIAEQMVEFTKNQILIQSGTAMLAQANIRPQSVLQLFR